MRRKTKLLVILVFVVTYGSSIILLRDKLPNQTATLVDVQNDKIQSLVVNQHQNSVIINVSLDSSVWNIKGQNVTVTNSGTRLVISGTYQNETSSLFSAKQMGLDLNFSRTSYLQAVISSKPDVTVGFLLGLRNLSPINLIALRSHPDAIAETDWETGVTWINASSPNQGEDIDDQTHYITIDVAEKLTNLGLDDQLCIGLQIRQDAIGFKPNGNQYETRIESISLLGELPYSIALSEGKSQALLDGSLVHIIKNSDIVNHIRDHPYLQRVYILFTMDAPPESLYTIFLLVRHGSSLTATRSGFVFTHTGHLSEVGTHVDWRRPIQLDLNFEPLATLYKLMEDGDYAVVFTPLVGSNLQSIQMHKIEFTFSKLQYSSFVITSLDEQVLLIMSVFLLVTAGILPTVLLFILFYVHRRNKLRADRKTAIRIIVIGLALRLILAPITAYADDIQIFSQIGSLYFGSGILGAQWVSLPGFAYIETAAYFPYALLRAFGFQDYQFLGLAVYSVEALFTKIPAILSDLGSFYFIWKIVTKYAPKQRMLLPAIYLLNPLTVYVSGILGQFDSIFAFVLIASIYYMIVEYKMIKTTVFSSLSAIINPVGLAMFIPLFTNVAFRENRKALTKSVLIAAGIIGVLILPFFFEPKSPVLLTSYERLVSGVPGESFYGGQIKFYTYGTLISSSVGYGLTFRFLLEIAGVQLGPIFYPYGAGIMFLLFACVFVYKMRKTYMAGEKNVLYTGTFMLVVASLFQLAFPTIFDQFVIWIAGLLLVSYALLQYREFLVIFTLISIATGFVYVFTWRNYLFLISGVEKAPLGNPYLANFASAFIGTIYSAMLFLILVLTFHKWMRKRKTIKS